MASSKLRDLFSSEFVVSSVSYSLVLFASGFIVGVEHENAVLGDANASELFKFVMDRRRARRTFHRCIEIAMMMTLMLMFKKVTAPNVDLN